MTFLCIGHRGASGHAPENTLKAFELAITMGCSWLELDVYHVEGELLVIHDDEVDRTTNGTGNVMDLTLSDLRALDAGDGEKIPTLREVIEQVDHRAAINVELKGADTAGAVNQLLDRYLSQGWDPKEFLISSFDHQELALADPRFARGALFHKFVPDWLRRAKKLDAWSVNLALKLVTEERVIDAHEAGFKVLVYTVNSRAEMQRMKDLGVDGVFTNYPDQFPKQVRGV